MTTGLILVDIQNDYFGGGRMELVDIDAAAIKARDLLSSFRGKKWPSFHIQHVSTRENAPFFLPGTKGVELHESIYPLDNDSVIQKHFPNSFLNTGLEKALKKSGIDRVIICGAMSHMCIDATVRAAADLGFACVVVQDACATKNLEFKGQIISAKEVHGAFMAALGSYAQVLDLVDIKNLLFE